MTLGLLGAFNFYALAGDIKPGSVPGSLNYQGRLERDNAPITGPIFLTFRIYNVATGGDPATCGNPGAACRWASPEAVVNAAQGIFSASITPPLDVFSVGGTLYLEVQVESDVLTPREPLNSVAYAMVAKKLEDGANVSVSSFTASHQVLLATTTGSNVGIGTISPDYKLTVNGGIRIVTGGILFPTGNMQMDAGVGSAGNISAAIDAIIVADNDGNGSGNIIFSKPSSTAAVITNAGDMGIGAGAVDAPMGKLDVDGSLYVGDEGIYDRDDGEINVKEDLVVEGGRVRGTGNNYISMGETADTIIAATNNTQRLWLDSSGNLGVGAAAAASERIHSSGNIRSDTGLRGSAVSVGAYTGWTSLANEVRGQTDLLLQQSNSYNVGIGTNTPREKLHVRGSIRADQGVIASTAAFADSVLIAINGDFTANSGHGNMVYLSSTIIYGTLQVTGGVGSDQGFPGYLASSQTFTGQNTFLNQVTVSSDIAAANRVGAGVKDFDFPASKYLQIGDNKPEFVNDNAMAYLVAGSSAEAKINFYRGAVETARLETLSGNYLPNLALVLNGQTKTLTDATYHRIQNSVVWISTGYATTPAIFVSSALGSIGMGTAVQDPAHRLTVEGNLRISTTSSPGQSYGLIFPDGSKMTTANLGSASSISNNTDALVQSDSDSDGSGSVILRAGSVDGLVLNSGGNIGVGTVSPLSKLNIRGGDLVLGAPSLSGGSGAEDLFVAGNVIVDGGIVQRSAATVVLSALTVSGDVLLSTAPAARTGIGTEAPGFRLDVAGDINASGVIKTGGATRISETGTVGSGGAGAAWDGTAIPVNRGGTGADLSGAAQGGIVYKTAGGLDATGALTGVLKGNNTGAPSAMTGTANTVAKWTDANTLGISTVSDNGTEVGIGVAPTGGVRLDVNGKLRTATFQMTAGGILNYVLTSDAGGNATWQSVDLLSSKDPTVGNEVTDAADTTLTRSGAGTSGNPYKLELNLLNDNTWTGVQTFSGGIGLTGVVKGNGAGPLTAADVILTSEVSGILPAANGGTGNAVANAATVTNGVYTTGSYADPGWITSIAGTKVSGNISGNAANVTGTVAVGNGGTGAATEAGARTNLGLGGGIVSQTITVKGGGAGADCTITISNGVITATTCP